MATFRILEDQENTNAHLRRQQKEAQVNVQQQKRSVLGILNNNVSRPAGLKQTKSDLNLCAKNKNEVEVKSSFSIFVDEESPKQEKKEVKKADASNTVFSLPEAIDRLPLQVELLCNDTPLHSPMAVDKSSDFKKPIKDSENKTWNKFMGFSEYFEDIYKYLRHAEKRSRAKANYMRQQPDVTASMRSILVDWLVEVGEEYKLQTETLYLAVSYIDRFLSYMSVLRAKLQLVGTAAMFIAAKYEEVFPPDVNEFAYITDDTYTKKTVLRMEQMILKVLSFDLSAPTVLSFLNIYSEGPLKSGFEETMSDHDKETIMYLAMFFSELSLVDGDPYLQFLPSVRAAAAIALARHTLEWRPVWTPALVKASGYQLSELLSCIKCLQATFEGAVNHPQQAVREKYKSNRWHNVSLHTPHSEPIC
ncbi:G2/mitotic-specific cyclin-A [Gryllus bimaculatus]|nr:G2/mitotic-specific cyclin-A [Gryllus bimaculatus]